VNRDEDEILNLRYFAAWTPTRLPLKLNKIAQNLGPNDIRSVLHGVGPKLDSSRFLLGISALIPISKTTKRKFHAPKITLEEVICLLLTGRYYFP